MSNHNYPFQRHGEIDATNNDELIKFPKIDRIDHSKCQHERVQIDSKLNSIFCISCKKEVNAVNWLIDHVEYITRMHNKIHEEKTKISLDMEILESRSRTRCVHCKKMTNINLKHHQFRIIE